ncbi:MAG: hypothetical protein EA427_01260 [Spirochaetaceae bacterium]|nr:MAG: hypothetical protein EA427_01260 [Spirochaetaceae bacterium]
MATVRAVPGRFARFIGPLLLAFFFSGGVPPAVLQAQAPAQAQAQAQALPALEGYAVLQAGPRLSRGMPLLPANSFSYIHATYDYEGTEIEVYLVPLFGLSHQGGALPDQRVWEHAACDAVRLEYVADEHLPLWRVRRERYVLYITIPAESSHGTVSVCGFAGPFVEVFEFFLREAPRRIETLRPLPEFPAVLEPNP